MKKKTTLVGLYLPNEYQKKLSFYLVFKGIYLKGLIIQAIEEISQLSKKEVANMQLYKIAEKNKFYRTSSLIETPIVAKLKKHSQIYRNMKIVSLQVKKIIDREYALDPILANKFSESLT